MHFYYDFDEWEMNDLENDPQEMNNVDDDPKIHLYSTGFKMELFEKWFVNVFSIVTIPLGLGNSLEFQYENRKKIN